MPDLSTRLHLDMLCNHAQQTALLTRLRRVARVLSGSDGVYGLEWGDPEVVPPLRFVRDRYVLPRVKADQTAVEIGAGGGRWTRYLLGFRELYLVDYHAELLEELRHNFHKPNMKFIKNNGSDFPGIPLSSVDFVFSFGCFVHLDRHLIEQYLGNIAQILRSGGTALIHYSDKTKIMAQLNASFSDNNPAVMRQMVERAGFRIVEEDLGTLWHGSLITFTH